MSENELIIQIPVTALRSNPKNPRAGVGDVAELASSMKQMGVLEPLIVVTDVGELTGDPTGTYTIVAGHRRHAAAKLAGLETVPCVIRSMVGIQQLRAMMTENIVRENMTAFDEAQGFQMMIDLGDTPADIVERTGFSTTTVRRRLKMAELDKDKLRAVVADEERQLTLGDFDRLAEIEDLEARNEVLGKIGTRDFDMAVNGALRAQKISRNLPTVEAWLKSVKAKELKDSDKWSGKYEDWPGASRIEITKLGDPGETLPETVEEPIFYYISYGTLYLKKKKAKAPREEKSPEQRAREKAVREAWELVDAKAKEFYELRTAFVDGITKLTNADRFEMMYGMVNAALIRHLCYVTDSGGRDIRNMMGLDTAEAWKRDFSVKVGEAITEVQDKDLPKVVQYIFGDGIRLNLTGVGSRSEFPRWERKGQAELLYRWLTKMGYEPSTEEAEWLCGDHPCFHAGEEPEC